MTRAPVLILALLLGGAQPALAQDPPPPSPPDIMRESARRLVDGIRRLVEQMPMFEAPRFTPEGDIILKRIRPPATDGEEARGPKPGQGGVDL